MTTPAEGKLAGTWIYIQTGVEMMTVK